MKSFATTVVAAVILCATAQVQPCQAQSCKLKNHSGGRTNVRNSALGVERARVIGSLRNGEALQFIGQSHDRHGNLWANVTLAAGTPGWVLGRDLNCVKPEKAALTRQPASPVTGPALPARTLEPAAPPPVAPPLAPRAETTASIPRNPELKCELRGQCSGLRQGIDSDDSSCPGGLGVADGTHKLALDASDKTLVMSRPDLEETVLKLSCGGGKCEATGEGADNSTKWSHALALSDNNRRVDYTYRIISDFGDGMSFAITHVYHGSCAP